MKLIPARSISSESAPPKDEEICVALEGLQIAQNSQSVASGELVEEHKTEEQCSPAEAKTDETDSAATEPDSPTEKQQQQHSDEDDIVVVKHEHAAEFLQQTNTPGKPY